MISTRIHILPNISARSTNLLILVSLAALMAFGTPFRFADSNSGRYLPILYRIVDPELFPDDPVVDSFERFRSVFYTGLGTAFKTVGASVMDVEPIFRALHIGLKLVLLGVLFFFVRPLNVGHHAFFLFAAWTIHEKAAGVGADSMFAPSLTHATLALVIGIAALGFQLRRLSTLFWLLVSVMLFVHVLMAVHLAMIVVVVLAVQERGRLSLTDWLGAAFFLLSFLFYYYRFAPPGFNTEEASLFIAAKGRMEHISPLGQSIFGWTKAVGQLGLALIVYRTQLYKRKPFDQLCAWMAAGAILAPIVGVAAISTNLYQISQLQPMRMFEWVNFIVFCILIFGVIETWKTDRMRSSVLLLIVLLNILDSLWLFPWLFLGIFAFGSLLIDADRTRFGRWINPVVWRWGSVFLLIPAIGFYVFREVHGYESFYDPIPVLVIFMCCMSAFGQPEAQRFRAEILALAAITISLLGRSVYVYEHIYERQDQAYLLACRWIAQHTPKDASFITAISGSSGGNFRARAMRTSLNENQNALYWVAPLAARENGMRSAEVLNAWQNDSWHLDTLFALARSWDADYLLVDSQAAIPAPFLYQAGPYYVMQVP